MKVQKREYLEPIEKGVFFFSKIDSFRKDQADYRMDPMEGKLNIDLGKPFLLNGIDISGSLKSAVMSYEYDGVILSLSMSIFDSSNFHNIENDLFAPNEEYIKEMSQFGDAFIIIDGEYLIACLKKALDQYQCNYAYGPVIYRDKDDPKDINEYYKTQGQLGRVYSELFIKDKKQYAKQNEWRFIIHDINETLSTQKKAGLSIQTAFVPSVPIHNIKFLRTVKVSKEDLS